MKIYLFILFLSLLIFYGCDNTPYPSIEECFELADLTPIPYYRIKNINTDSGFAEYNSVITLIVSYNDYNRITNQIQNKPFFVKYDSNFVPKSVFENKIDKSKVSEIADYHNGAFFYERFDPSSRRSIRVLLEKDSLIIIQYIDY